MMDHPEETRDIVPGNSSLDDSEAHAGPQPPLSPHEVSDMSSEQRPDGNDNGSRLLHAEPASSGPLPPTIIEPDTAHSGTSTPLPHALRLVNQDSCPIPWETYSPRVKQPEAATRQARRKRRCWPAGPISWWWWWEIAAAGLSMGCMCLILVVLFRGGDMALADWRLPIQPNSLIAVFTTVGKTAMLVSVASCISQLKWRHFLRRRTRLSHLQLLDDASRGPWGSLVLLLKMRFQALTAAALALVSLVALGIDPSAQQILEFPTRSAALTGVETEIGIARRFYSKGYAPDLGGDGRSGMITLPNNDLFKLQSAIIDGIAGSVSPPHLVCPGDRCSWDNFTTLGVCSEFRNVTDAVQRNCTGSVTSVMNCTYGYPSDLVPPEKPIVASFAYQLGALSAPTTLFQSTGQQGDPRKPGNQGHVILYSVRVTDNTMDESKPLVPPKTEAFYSSWFWCAQTHHNVTATPSGIASGSVTSEKLVLVDLPPSSRVVAAMDVGYVAPSDPTVIYNVTNIANFELFANLATLLETRVRDVYPHTSDDFSPRLINLAYFLYTSDLANVTRNLAATMTNQVRSREPGDNANATAFAGRAFRDEIYIRVRWPWLLLPLLETLLAAALLAVSIALTRRQPLLKGSAIALLVHGLHGWAADELEVEDPETAQKLEHMAERIEARLARDAEGRLKLMRWANGSESSF